MWHTHTHARANTHTHTHTHTRANSRRALTARVRRLSGRSLATMLARWRYVAHTHTRACKHTHTHTHTHTRKLTQGFDSKGQETFWTVTGDNVGAMAFCGTHTHTRVQTHTHTHTHTHAQTHAGL